ncbi:MAG TPA: glycosyltransferase family 2 protein [Chitinophagaceae bacterium]|nr:glycosyltransferase family 2 protein [Chitinophagaceae bacterium]
MNLLSVVIISFNEEENIGRCIDSVRKIADEIIVVDSFSTDRTREIAVQKGATVKQEKFRGYIQQKNLALQLATHNFTLSIDADESLDERLAIAIASEKKHFRSKAYSMNRCANYCGRFIRHGLWYPDKKVRLFDKRIASWGGINPHDKIELKENISIRHLKGDILHYSYNSIEEHMVQSNNFTTISAVSMYERGQRSNWMKILVNPFWTFLHGYFIRLGFLDGFYGLVIAINSAHQTFLKYIKLYRLQRK